MPFVFDKFKSKNGLLFVCVLRLVFVLLSSDLCSSCFAFILMGIERERES